jgi:hypothetical protein
MNQPLIDEVLRSRAGISTRRHFLKNCQLGLGAIALSQLSATVSLPPGTVDFGFSGEPSAPNDNPLAVKKPMHPARAKNVIYLHMAGSPPQHELFDFKPALAQAHGQDCPSEFVEGKTFAFIMGRPTLLGPQAEFLQHGESGTWISNHLPHLSQHADDLCVINSMFTDQFNHAPAQLLLHTGNAQFGSAAFGSWVMYGLGSENQNLPGYVVLVSGGNMPSGGKSLWGSGFLPSVYQGVQCRSVGDPILYVTDPPGVSRELRRASIEALNQLNHLELQQYNQPETLTRIRQYELAFRMQMAVPDVMDISRESADCLESYGARPGEASFANNCLLARKLVENGVRFVQLFDWGWDVHGTAPHDDLITQLPQKCRETDRPIAALLADLKQRGLLDDTLVIWGGEFGRTPMNEARGGSKYLGRDHHPDCFTIWLAGGKTNAGATIGRTDELGYRIAENGISIRDLQATLMHILGIDPHRLVYPFQGLNRRWIGPDNEPKVRTELLG